MLQIRPIQRKARKYNDKGNIDTSLSGEKHRVNSSSHSVNGDDHSYAKGQILTPESRNPSIPIDNKMAQSIM